MEGLWRGCFAMIGMKKLQDTFGCGICTIIHSMVLHVFSFKKLRLVLLIQM